MQRRDFYVRACASALAETPIEHRREAWRDLEAQFYAEFGREHSTAPSDAASDAFLALAQEIGLRLQQLEQRRPTLRLPRG